VVGSNNLFHGPKDELGVEFVRGSRPLKTICGHTCAEKNSARDGVHDPKRLPSNPLLSPLTPVFPAQLEIRG
jgi:hypothetical protein